MELNPKWIRAFAPGFIGGQKVAEMATDEEIVMLARLQDEIAKGYNHLQELERIFSRLVEAIKERQGG